jgi:D-alanyl-D-alanine carboxypeptidase/D-alanyl-D-alanine-endopeptidase (penicillin-binding protein 4)
MSLTRRFFLSSALGAVAGTAFANAPDTSVRPVARTRGTPAAAEVTDLRPRARVSFEQLVADSGVTGTVGFVVLDPGTGATLVDIDGTVPLPPASATKAVTALYALEALGPDYRFVTRVIASGPVVDGVVQGDLILAGGGHPNLVTDELAVLVDRVADAGITEVTGRFLVWGDALPREFEIDPDQLDHLGYNPSVGGLNLNFNRVHFQWQRSAGAYTVDMDAPGTSVRPAVTTARMEIVDRAGPVYTYRDAGGVDEWTVARGALGDAGSRWLPVRYPALYTADVFATLMRSKGIVLPTVERIDALPEGAEIARHESEPLVEILESLLRWSTNITAEAVGMTATHAAIGSGFDLDTSAARMTVFTAERAGIAPFFEDHSGLGDGTLISAADMAKLLGAPGVQAQLRPILREITLTDAEGNALSSLQADVRAKTGTLNFVSALAGYIRTQSGKDLIFAFFAADLVARERGKQSDDERPAGSITYNGRAKRLQQRLLQRLAMMNMDQPDLAAAGAD